MPMGSEDVMIVPTATSGMNTNENIANAAAFISLI
jgi:hypothetical protein